MELSVLLVLAMAVGLILFSARPGARKCRRASGRPLLWRKSSGIDSVAWLGSSGGGAWGAAPHDSGSSPHDGVFHSSTNAASDGGAFDGGGGDGGGGDGGGH